MKHITRPFAYCIAAIIGTAGLVALPMSVAAVSATTTSTAATNAATTAAQQARLQRIITRGNLEIDRRLATLNTLGSKISSATKLTSSDAATLSGTVSGDITSLNTLKTQLDADTTVTAAISDAQSIITNYRVYVLVVPQVDLVKTADDQQVAESKLTTLASKLQSRITAEQQKGTDVSSLQTTLADLNSNVTAAQAISSNIETTVITLVPSDYNTNHSVLLGDRNQLVTAQTDIQAAITDAQNIMSQLTAASSSPTPAQP